MASPALHTLLYKSIHQHEQFNVMLLPRIHAANGAAPGDTSALLQDRDGGLVDGNGGAVCTEEGSATTFTRKSSMLRNRAVGSGGAIFNAGIMTFETSAEFRGNKAGVSAAAAMVRVIL